MTSPHYPKPGLFAIFLGLACVCASAANAQTLIADREDLLPMMNGLATYLATLQDEHGAIVDPIIHREHQYSTPYFAAGVACLADANQASPELLQSGVRAMDKATADFAAGHANIPDGHGEFYIAALTLALEWFEDRVDEVRWQQWRERLTTPIHRVIESVTAKTNNWRTYAMKGEWVRAQAGLVEREDAIAFIEDAWLNRTQRERIVLDRQALYQDWNGDPQSHAVEAVGRGNLMALIAHGYDGPSAAEIREAVERGTANALFLQDPNGQCPPNGRTDNHVFNDLLYALIFDAMAERTWAGGDRGRAGQCRRAAQLGYGSILQWKRDDGAWAGSFCVTKNHFDPADRTGYQPASQYSNYNATILFHLAEAWHTWQTDIPPKPTPAESETYVLENDEAFGSVVIAAGGTQVFINLRGDSVPKYGQYWTPLGIVRIAKRGWDGRLGPSDGHFDAAMEKGVSFSPVWQESGRWVSLTEKAQDYRGKVAGVTTGRDGTAECTVLYAPVTGSGGPAFYIGLTVSAEGIGIRLRSPNTQNIGLLVPCIESDGRQAFESIVESKTLRTAAAGQSDSRDLRIETDKFALEPGDSFKTAVGQLSTYRLTTSEPSLDIFIALEGATDRR